jgi:hypothetical protein
MTLLDNVLIVLDDEMGLRVTTLTDLGFAFLYSLEVAVKISAWGFTGGPLSFWNVSVFNRFDLVVSIAAWLELLARSLKFDYTLRSLKVFRLIRPLVEFLLFAGLAAVMRTLAVCCACVYVCVCV